jgi:GntR family transcriptional regulator
VPADIGARFSEEDLNLLSLMSLFERSGIRIGGARQSFSAALADPKIAQSLGVAVGTPLLAITRTVFDDNTRPVKFIRILYRTDRYQYRMTMERDSKPSSRYRTTLAALDDDLAG